MKNKYYKKGKIQLLKNSVKILAYTLFIVSGINKNSITNIIFLLVSIIIFYFLTKNISVNRIIFKSLLIMQIWLIPSLLLIFNIKHLSFHYKDIIYTSIYISISIIIIFNNSDTINNFYMFINKIIIIFIFINYFYFLLSIIGIISYPENEYSGVYSNRNTLAVGASFLLVIISTKIRFNIKNYKELIYLILLSIIILLTQSSKGFIGLSYSYIIIILSNIRKKHNILKICVLITLIIIIISFLGLPSLERLKKQYIGIIGDEKNTTVSTLERLWLIKESWSLIKSNLYTGIGLNNSQFYLLPSRLNKLGSGGFGSGGTYSHINYLEILLSSGLFGFLLYYFPIIICFYFSIIFRKNIKYKKIVFLIISIIFLKLIFDFAMVSYNSFISNLFYSSAVVFFLRIKYNKI